MHVDKKARGTKLDDRSRLSVYLGIVNGPNCVYIMGSKKLGRSKNDTLDESKCPAGGTIKKFQTKMNCISSKETTVLNGFGKFPSRGITSNRCNNIRAP